MQNQEKWSIPALMNGILRINNKIAENYLKNRSGYHHDSLDILTSFYKLYIEIISKPKEYEKIQSNLFHYYKGLIAITKNVFVDRLLKNQTGSVIIPEKKDKRFLSSEWNRYPYFNFLEQNYLLFEKAADQLIEDLDISLKQRKKIEFYANQYIDLLSPSNFLITNPEVIKLAFETRGESLWKGFQNLVHDVENGKITQVDETAFEVGRNLAITPGSVIYENELIQLIQNAPSTKKVYEIPLLIIPPWINKYYVLDLQPHNSFVNYFIQQGFTVYIISWRNPKPGMGDLSMDDYVEKGVLKAIEVAENISHSNKINTLGYCIGGTLQGIALSILSVRKKENPVNYATFLATIIDFDDIGPMGNLINRALVKKLERGELLNDGVFHGYDMERAFNLIRANDLVWKYVIDNYLKGLKPAAFDVMYWTNDNTNLPAKMYLFYMKKMVLENLLRVKNGLTICRTPIDIGSITIPVCVINFTEDYIAPARTGYKITKLVGGLSEYILGGAGHVMGAINHPSNNKYGYYLNGKPGKSFEEWKRTAATFEGSWWTAWAEKLQNNSGKQIPAPTVPGNDRFKVIEPAPGSYVKEKCDD